MIRRFVNWLLEDEPPFVDCERERKEQAAERVASVFQELLDRCPAIERKLSKEKSPTYDDFVELWDGIRRFGYEFLERRRSHESCCRY